MSTKLTSHPEIMVQPDKKVTFILLNADLHILHDNQTFAIWVGLVNKPLAQRKITEIFPELADIEETISQLLKKLDDPFVLSKLYRLTANSQDAYYQVQIEPFPPIPDTLICFLTDITEQTYMEQYLRQKRGQSPNQTIAEHEQARIMLEQQNRDLLYLNRASRLLHTALTPSQVLENLLQLSAELVAAEGSSIWLWDKHNPEVLVCRAAYHKNYAPPIVNHRLRAGQGIAGWAASEGKVVVASNTIQDNRFFSGVDAQTGFRTLSILAVPLQLGNKLLGVLELVNKIDGDFTVDDRVSGETLAATASIAIENANLMEELRQQNIELRAGNDELDSFANSVAHALQNPLSVIIGFADLLTQEGIVFTEDKKQRVLKAIAKNVSKMSNMIQELLLISGLRKSDIQLRPLRMESILNTVQGRLSYLIEEYNAQIQLPTEWPIALGYATWVEEIWENYLSNAIKYGGTPPMIECGADIKAEDHICFWVRDNGIGIPPEAQVDLFRPFTSFNQIKVSGSGLGLAVVQRLVEKLGGRVDVQSLEGQGSIFSFTLPSAPKSNGNGHGHGSS